MQRAGEKHPFEQAVAAYKAGRSAEAEEFLRRVMRRGKCPTDVPLLLSKVLIDLGKADQALFELGRIPKSDPSYLGVLLMCAKAYAALKRTDDHLSTLEQAASAYPKSDETLTLLGRALAGEDRPLDAERCYRQALAMAPDNGAATLGLAQALGVRMGMKEAAELLRANIRAYPNRVGVSQGLLFLLHDLDDVSPEELFRMHVETSRTIALAAGPARRTGVPADPERRLTIGYISPDLRQHSCAYFIEPLLANHDRERFRVIAYNTAEMGDQVTTRLKTLVDDWRDVSALDAAALADQIVSDRVDIAVDLAGHTQGNRLNALAMRPAPVIVTYLGYPNTTGLGAVGYRIVDALTDPSGADSLATETLVRLPGSFLAYRPPTDSPPVAPVPCRGAGHITFGSFNSLAKLSPSTVRTWARVLEAVPGSRLALKGKALGQEQTRPRVLEYLAEQGLDTSRVDAMPWVPGVREHLELYSRVDIALDPFPYCGTTTTCEALWMGAPVVTLAGRTHASRVGVSLLSAVGLPELIGATTEDYIHIASDLARDADRLSDLRSGLRARVQASPLRDEQGHAREFESALRTMWRSWCASRI